MKFLKTTRMPVSLISGLLLLTTVLSCNADKKTSNEQPATTAQSSATATTESAPAGKKVILFYGNSLTAGYGVEQSEAFPALVGEKIDSAGLGYTVVNAGLSGETTAGGKSRIGWVMRQPISIFVLELGGNDGLRGLPLAQTRQNLQAIIDTVRLKSPDARIVLAGMQIPPNLGTDYSREFRELFKEVADKNNAVLIPFLLENVGGIAKLNQSDGIHPTPAGHKIVAKTVWEVVKPLL